ncbi:MAG: hypothetical protein ACFB10_14380 [Salibacteraceae bacterium]
MLRDEGTTQVTASATANHLSLQTAKLYQPNRAWMANTQIDLRGRLLVEGGLGYVRPLTDFNMFDVYAGYGFGRIATDYNVADFTVFTATRDGEYTHRINTTYHKLFIQPSFAGNLSFDEQLGLSLRTSLVYFPKYEFESVFNGFDGTFIFTADSDTLMAENAVGVIFDPVATFRTMWGNSSLVIQGGYSFPFFPDLQGDFYEHPVYHRIIFSLSYQHRFPQKRPKKRSSKGTTF